MTRPSRLLLSATIVSQQAASEVTRADRIAGFWLCSTAVVAGGICLASILDFIHPPLRVTIVSGCISAIASGVLIWSPPGVRRAIAEFLLAPWV